MTIQKRKSIIENLLTVDFPDPFVLREGAEYYAYATNARGYNVQLLHSHDLHTWEHLGDALPQLPAWAAAGQSLTWAPSVLKRNETYVLYYTARFAAAGLQCLGCASSESPGGPFRDASSRPFLCQEHLGGSIDPSPFVEDDGSAYLLWKNDGNSCELPTGLWLQALRTDGLAVEGEAVELLRRDQPWELPLVEAPALVKHAGRYYLFYSGNWWESADYAISYAVSHALAGPYIKPDAQPWFTRQEDVLGPGGQEFFTTPEEQLWMAYHAWTAPNVGYPSGTRSLHLAPIVFKDGHPAVKTT
ncbi:MAG: family 43 glycosylhydrolase [Anaerolineae bacterium]|nr:family 43 glycosylhydrolase [Anaerolineae bacterium]